MSRPLHVIWRCDVMNLTCRGRFLKFCAWLVQGHWKIKVSPGQDDIVRRRLQWCWFLASEFRVVGLMRSNSQSHQSTPGWPHRTMNLEICYFLLLCVTLKTSKVGIAGKDECLWLTVKDGIFLDEALVNEAIVMLDGSIWPLDDVIQASLHETFFRLGGENGRKTEKAHLCVSEPTERWLDNCIHPCAST